MKPSQMSMLKAIHDLAHLTTSDKLIRISCNWAHAEVICFQLACILYFWHVDSNVRIRWAEATPDQYHVVFPLLSFFQVLHAQHSEHGGNYRVILVNGISIVDTKSFHLNISPKRNTKCQNIKLGHSCFGFKFNAEAKLIRTFQCIFFRNCFSFLQMGPDWHQIFARMMLCHRLEISYLILAE